MAGIIQVDLLVKTALEAAIYDMRKNPYVLEDVYAWLGCDVLAKTDYGYKEIAAFMKWFQSTDIPIYLNHRTDAPQFPCITIVTAPRSEMLGRANLGDDGMDEEIPAKKVTRAPVSVYPNFTPKAYDRTTGLVTFPDGMNTGQMAPGQMLVSKANRAFEIEEIVGDDSFRIKAGTTEDFMDAYIVTASSLWNLHRELMVVQESVFVGCHAQSDAVHCAWLHDIVWYCLMRYKESYLEGRGFELSTISSDPLVQNSNFTDADRVFSRIINLNGQLQMSWIKYVAPKFQKVTGGIKIITGKKTPDGYKKEVQRQGWQNANDDDDEGLM